VILGFAKKACLQTHDENEILRNCVRKVITDAPTYFIEREMTLKLEAQTQANHRE
jgi:hypothetical protein